MGRKIYKPVSLAAVGCLAACQPSSERIVEIAEQCGIKNLRFTSSHWLAAIRLREYHETGLYFGAEPPGHGKLVARQSRIHGCLIPRAKAEGIEIDYPITVIIN
ncbi:hypothetical protein FIM10_03820 [Sphingomonadales bacterium 56]|uniref:hypothetical protein n=1 Tax=unclassified Sphingobium TaxID=2611147 RepID=UPI00191A1F9D|nr:MULTISPECIES: hypothetical protein [unclassified Sphingobium]MBY2927803.1 hypothetical protein [Sphingomonadales bacterium 56]MBY2957903.1 hypothetical protein [Sphingomonadales bacterium 58]